MPAMSSNGLWTKLPLSIDEANVNIRELFEKLNMPVGNKNIGTHSCKSTLLDWCGKYGMGAESRTLLGGHVVKNDQTMLIYNRDALAGPLMQLESMILEVRAGTFLPDETRSRRRPPREVCAAREEPAAGPKVPNQAEQSSSSEDDSDSDESGSGRMEKTVHQLELSEKSRPGKAFFKENMTLWRHTRYSTYHLHPDSTPGMFKCRRPQNNRYEQCPNVPATIVPKCSDCFKDVSDTEEE